MSGKDTLIPKKRRGPEPTGQGTPVMVRLQPDQLAALDAWRQNGAKDGQPVSRPEAVRLILKTTLFA